MNRTPVIFEPELEGAIAIRRPHASVTQGTIVEPHGGSPSALHASLADPPLQVADFERIEDYLRAYLEHERFRSAHPLACGRWIVAWEMLWCADSRAKVIGVGRRARDAMQAFTTSLLERCMPLAMDPHWPEELADPSQRPEPLEGLSTVIGAYSADLGDERHELLCGLLDQWRALLETVQRHERDGRGVDQRLRWEDGRRLVLFTALVMVETDRSFA